MNYFATLLILLFSTALIAQTKLISHKSHSGSASDFKLAIENNLFDIGASNMGAAPIKVVRNASLDTLVYVSESKVVMITSEHCDNISRFEKNKIEGSRIWDAGKDTLYNHVLFSKNHSLDSIKEVLKQQYNFRNDIDDVTFIGYDNKTKKYKKEAKKSKEKDENKGLMLLPNDSHFPPKYVLYIALALFSLLMVFVFQKTKLKNTIR